MSFPHPLKRIRAAFQDGLTAIKANTEAARAGAAAAEALTAAIENPATLERLTTLLERIETATAYQAGHFRHERVSSGRPTEF